MKAKNFEKIVIGYHEIEVWYFSPFPEEATKNNIVYICEKCLKYMNNKNALIAHKVNI